jgi:hypothetical protein
VGSESRSGKAREVSAPWLRCRIEQPRGTRCLFGKLPQPRVSPEFGEQRAALAQAEDVFGRHV